MDGGDLNSCVYGKPFEYELSFLIGYEFFGKLSIQFGEKFGLANLQPRVNGVTNQAKLKNSGFGIALGHKF